MKLVARSGSLRLAVHDALTPAGVRHSSCKSFTIRTGGGPLLIMCGRVALDRAEALLQPANLEQGCVAALSQLTQARLGRGESTRWVEGLRSSFLSAIFYAIVPRLLGCELWCVWHKGIRYRLPAATHDQRIGRSPRFGRIGPALQRALERPVLHIICCPLARPHLSLITSLLRQSSCTLLLSSFASSVFSASLREFLWPSGKPPSTHPPLSHFSRCLGGRALRAAWWLHARG